jgi:hypothetical protein
MSPALRQAVRQRAGERYEYCRLPDWLDYLDPFHVEHVLPRQHGGDDHPENLAWACSRCNHRKGTNLAAIGPDTGFQAALFDPRRDHWTDPFEFNAGWIYGRTATGRATVWLLAMNVPRREEVRRLLFKAGLW